MVVARATPAPRRLRKRGPRRDLLRRGSETRGSGSPGRGVLGRSHRGAPKDEHAIAGTAVGAVVGGAIGKDVGDRDLTTAAGAAAGAFIGRKIQKQIQENRAEERTVTTIERRCAPVGALTALTHRSSPDEKGRTREGSAIFFAPPGPRLRCANENDLQ